MYHYLAHIATGMHYGAPKKTFQITERLRRDMTEAEKIIWERVCKNKLGIRIRRQHPIWKFIADFYCHELKLVIKIMRLTNELVINETDWVVGEIKSKIELLRQKQIQKLN